MEQQQVIVGYGHIITVGSILKDMDPRSYSQIHGPRTIKVTGISVDGKTIYGKDVRTGRATRISVARITRTYGQSNGYQLVS